ncbi:kynurenine formamidase [Ulvibacter sp. MAR_2010_11]|uniref:cyclase family protein n=1 Tax=Ulvibacter sp. MAR_2010_11 TaxID=1250229 RepID=UPI000C2CCBF1|nr:cyclase family protein [Ulvibacter sp. MAR_2010_11]PKA82586.1 kynurenine formamidase [Ulvibacter sp. MAR_2010_11]
MKATIHINDQLITIDLSKPLDISIQLQASSENPLAWYLDAPRIEPVKIDDWVGKISEGASVNFNNIWFNPHSHGTHTECVGHISKEFHSVNEALKEFFFVAEVISVAPQTLGEDLIIPKKQLITLLKGKNPEAVVIRTLPNTHSKKSRKYSHTNWPYLEEAAALYLRELGVKHLLIDLPSVDKEKDDGKLLAHKAFWNYPKAPRHEATITEFIYVPNSVKDGAYLLNLQVAPFKNDAAPSRPVLFQFL